MAQNNIFKVEIKDNIAKSPEFKTRVPSKILHFSDGNVECYDEDENVTEKSEENQTVIDPSQLNWGPWFAHKAIYTGKRVLSACDYAGETLAYYLGITSPKYQFEIQEYERMQRLKTEEAEKIKTEGWESNQNCSVNTQQPHLPDAVV